MSLLAFFTGAIAFPFVISSSITFAKLNLNKKDTLSSSLTIGIYKHIANKWLKKYLEDSESLTEKKYKIIFLSIWLKEKSLNFQSIFGIDNDILRNLAEEIVNKKESNYYIDFLSTMKSYYISKDKEGISNPIDLIMEDINNENKIDIAKKVYQEFKNCGILGANINYWHTSSLVYPLMIMQDYKLSEADKLNVKKITKFNQQTIDKHRLEYDNIDNDIISKMINVEGNKESLQLLMSFIKSRQGISKKNINHQDAIEKIGKKIHYGDLYNSINEKVLYKNETTPLPRKIGTNPSVYFLLMYLNKRVLILELMLIF